MFPVGDTNVRGASFPLVNWFIIIVNVLIFLYESMLGQSGQSQFILTYGVIPEDILRGEGLLTLITSVFVHGGWVHLIGNMLFLWVCGDNLEAVMGHVVYLMFYLLGGLAASGVHVLLHASSDIPSVGASGAISAVLGAYLVMFPGSRIRLLVPFGRTMRMTTVSALIFLGLWFVQQLISGLLSLGTMTVQTTGIAWWAHIGGFVAGVIVGFLFRSSAAGHSMERT